MLFVKAQYRTNIAISAEITYHKRQKLTNCTVYLFEHINSVILINFAYDIGQIHIIII